MTPHYSSLVAGRYFEKVEEARAELGGDFQIVNNIRSWHRHPLLVHAIADNIVADGDHRISAVSITEIP